jgi:hypothetical protein
MIGLRWHDPQLKSIDEWRRNQADLPNRAEAIRRLVELGLHSPTEPKKKKGLTGIMVKR